jgi:hypothetical protein
MPVEIIRVGFFQGLPGVASGVVGFLGESQSPSRNSHHQTLSAPFLGRPAALQSTTMYVSNRYAASVGPRCQTC